MGLPISSSNSNRTTDEDQSDFKMAVLQLPRNADRQMERRKEKNRIEKRTGHAARVVYQRASDERLRLGMAIVGLLSCDVSSVHFAYLFQTTRRRDANRKECLVLGACSRAFAIDRLSRQPDAGRIRLESIYKEPASHILMVYALNYDR